MEEAKITITQREYDPSNYAETIAWHVGRLLQPDAGPLAKPPRLVLLPTVY